MLQIEGFRKVGTGGNCEALQLSTDHFNFLLTGIDGMNVPESFPILFGVRNQDEEEILVVEVTSSERLQQILDTFKHLETLLEGD